MSIFSANRDTYSAFVKSVSPFHLNSKLVSYLTTTPASFVAFATTLMDWFRGQTIFRRRTNKRTGAG